MRPKPMLLLLCLSVLAILLPRPAWSGPNAGGTLIVHYTAGLPVPPNAGFVEGGLTSCAATVAQAPADQPVLWHVYAAFPPNSHPRLKVVPFGCDFDVDRLAILWTAPRPRALEITYPGPWGWPYPGSGQTLALFETLTDVVSEIHCFAGYAPSGEFFATVRHPDPNLVPAFADDGEPSTMDLIADYGTLGFGVTGRTPCPPAQTLGACCREDGHCELLSEAACDLPGDLYQGDGSACPPDGICTGEIGACCTVTPNGACEILSLGQCTERGALFMGFNSTCSPNPCPDHLGACCEGYGCRVTQIEECPSPQNWYFGEPCVPGYCEGGACCNPNTGRCYLMIRLVCIEVSSFLWLGGACLPNPCPQPGACCDAVTGLCTLRSQSECHDIGGDYLGNGTSCGDPNDPQTNPCRQPVIGACCSLVTGECFLFTQGACHALGVQWRFLGEGTVCSPNPCEAGTGACCLVVTSGACEIRTQEDCRMVGGVWGGLDVACSPELCPDSLGACCLPNMTCIVTVREECPEPFVWTPLMPCVPGACQETGACCLSSGDCTVMTELQCLAAQGRYTGNDVPCTPDPCHSTPTQSTSWGRIKILYRF